MSLSMATTLKQFDAVEESRQWKETVSRNTKGLSRQQLLACFNREAVRQHFQEKLKHARIQTPE